MTFAAQDLLPITEHGHALCKILDKMKATEFQRLRKKLCQGGLQWFGYTATDGFTNNNEIFIGNSIALRDVFARATAEAKKADGVVVYRLIVMEADEYERDLKLIVGPKIKKFELDMDNTATSKEYFASFNAWVKELTQFYGQHD